jgi:hypothetical protein
LLVAQSVPFLFVTGYAPRSVDPRFVQVPILQKPILQDELAGMLQHVLAKAPRAVGQGVSAA